MSSFLIILYGCADTQKIGLEKKLTISYFNILEIPDTLSLKMDRMLIAHYLIKNHLEKDVKIIYPYVSNMRARYSKKLNGVYLITDTLCDYFLPEPPPDLDFKDTILRKGDSLLITLYHYPPLCILGSEGQYELNFFFFFFIIRKTYCS